MKDDETSSPAVAEAEDEPVAPVIAVMMLMALQHGAASDGQLRTKGLTARRQNAFIERGHLRRHAPGVVIDPGSPETWHRLAMAATLAPGADAVLSGAAAARLHGFDGFADINRIIVVIPHGRSIRAARGVTVVTARYLPVMDLTTVDGIRTLTIAATLVSLARVRHSSLFQALDSALRDGSDAAELRREFERHRRN